MDSTKRHAVDREREVSPAPTTRGTQKRLTETLLTSSPNEYQAATQHPFLKAAGQGTLLKHDLSRWLSQDRLYAETYISFISSLLAKVTLPYAFIEDKDSSLRWRIIRLLTGALENIHREIDFFTNMARTYDLQLDLPFSRDSEHFGPNDVTDQYLALFRSFHLDPQQSLLEGLLVLWATEKCYLDAWSYAAMFLDKETDPGQDADGGALRSGFIPNWTSTEFAKFVQDLADVADELAAREGGLKKIDVLKVLWLNVLGIESRFWPDIGNT